MKPEFTGIHIFVRDMKTALDFYRRLGIELPRDADKQEHVLVTLPGGMELAFGTLELTRKYDPKFAPPRGSPNSLQFAVDSRADVDRIHAELVAAGYTSHLAPHDAFWGSRYAVVDDPDGNVVGFQSPQDGPRRNV